MRYRYPTVVELVAVAYTGFQCRGLASNWLHSPLDRFGWLAFLLWIVPVIYFWLRHGCRRTQKQGTVQAMIATGLALSLLGTLADFNALKHAGLATVLAGLIPFRAGLIPWYVLAITWTSVFTWIAMRFAPTLILPLRLSLSAAATAFGILGCLSATRERVYEEH